MICQLEAALEIAVGNAKVQEIAVVIAIQLFLAGNDQQIFLRSDVYLVGLEASNGNRDQIFGIGGPLDVERRVIITLRGARIFQKIEQTVKADGCAAIGRKVKTCHSKFSNLSNLRFESLPVQRFPSWY
jgi:hypothetical protein